MSKKYVAFGLAILAAVVVAVMFVNFNSKSPLPELTKANASTELGKADKPVLVIVSDGRCALCSKFAAKQTPAMKFMHASGKALGAPSNSLPAVIIFVPEIGETYVKENFNPSDIDAFIAERLNFANKEMDSLKKIKELQAKFVAAGKPFDEEMAALQKEVDNLDSLKALEGKYTAAQSKADQASADFQSQIDAVVTKRDAAAKDANAQVTALENRNAPQADIDAARAKADAIAKPFNDEIAALQAKRLATTKPLYDDVETIEGQINDVLKPYKAKAADIKTRKQAAQESLKADLNAAVTELKDLMKQDNSAPVK